MKAKMEQLSSLYLIGNWGQSNFPFIRQLRYNVTVKNNDTPIYDEKGILGKTKHLFVGYLYTKELVACFFEISPLYNCIIDTAFMLIP